MTSIFSKIAKSLLAKVAATTNEQIDSFIGLLSLKGETLLQRSTISQEGDFDLQFWGNLTELPAMREFTDTLSAIAPKNEETILEILKLLPINSQIHKEFFQIVQSHSSGKTKIRMRSLQEPLNLQSGSKDSEPASFDAMIDMAQNSLLHPGFYTLTESLANILIARVLGQILPKTNSVPEQLIDNITSIFIETEKKLEIDRVGILGASKSRVALEFEKKTLDSWSDLVIPHVSPEGMIERLVPTLEGVTQMPGLPPQLENDPLMNSKIRLLRLIGSIKFTQSALNTTQGERLLEVFLREFQAEKKRKGNVHKLILLAFAEITPHILCALPTTRTDSMALHVNGLYEFVRGLAAKKNPTKPYCVESMAMIINRTPEHPEFKVFYNDKILKRLVDKTKRPYCLACIKDLAIVKPEGSIVMLESALKILTGSKIVFRTGEEDKVAEVLSIISPDVTGFQDKFISSKNLTNRHIGISLFQGTEWRKLEDPFMVSFSKITGNPKDFTTYATTTAWPLSQEMSTLKKRRQAASSEAIKALFPEYSPEDGWTGATGEPLQYYRNFKDTWAISEKTQGSSLRSFSKTLSTEIMELEDHIRLLTKIAKTVRWASPAEVPIEFVTLIIHPSIELPKCIEEGMCRGPNGETTEPPYNHLFKLARRFIRPNPPKLGALVRILEAILNFSPAEIRSTIEMENITALLFSNPNPSVRFLAVEIAAKLSGTDILISKLINDNSLGDEILKKYSTIDPSAIPSELKNQTLPIDAIGSENPVLWISGTLTLYSKLIQLRSENGLRLSQKVEESIIRISNHPKRKNLSDYFCSTVLSSVALMQKDLDGEWLVKYGKYLMEISFPSAILRLNRTRFSSLIALVESIPTKEAAGFFAGKLLGWFFSNYLKLNLPENENEPIPHKQVLKAIKTGKIHKTWIAVLAKVTELLASMHVRYVDNCPTGLVTSLIQMNSSVILGTKLDVSELKRNFSITKGESNSKMLLTYLRFVTAYSKLSGIVYETEDGQVVRITLSALRSRVFMNLRLLSGVGLGAKLFSTFISSVIESDATKDIDLNPAAIKLRMQLNTQIDHAQLSLRNATFLSITQFFSAWSSRKDVLNAFAETDIQEWFFEAERQGHDVFSKVLLRLDFGSFIGIFLDYAHGPDEQVAYMFTRSLLAHLATRNGDLSLARHAGGLIFFALSQICKPGNEELTKMALDHLICYTPTMYGLGEEKDENLEASLIEMAPKLTFFDSEKRMKLAIEISSSIASSSAAAFTESVLFEALDRVKQALWTEYSQGIQKLRLIKPWLKNVALRSAGNFQIIRGDVVMSSVRKTSEDLLSEMMGVSIEANKNSGIIRELDKSWSELSLNGAFEGNVHLVINYLFQQATSGGKDERTAVLHIINRCYEVEQNLVISAVIGSISEESTELHLKLFNDFALTNIDALRAHFPQVMLHRIAISKETNAQVAEKTLLTFEKILGMGIVSTIGSWGIKKEVRELAIHDALLGNLSKLPANVELLAQIEGVIQIEKWIRSALASRMAQILLQNNENPIIKYLAFLSEAPASFEEEECWVIVGSLLRVDAEDSSDEIWNIALKTLKNQPRGPTKISEEFKVSVGVLEAKLLSLSGGANWELASEIERVFLGIDGIARCSLKCNSNDVDFNISVLKSVLEHGGRSPVPAVNEILNTIEENIERVPAKTLKSLVNSVIDMIPFTSISESFLSKMVVNANFPEESDEESTETEESLPEFYESGMIITTQNLERIASNKLSESQILILNGYKGQKELFLEDQKDLIKKELSSIQKREANLTLSRRTLIGSIRDVMLQVSSFSTEARDEMESEKVTEVFGDSSMEISRGTLGIDIEDSSKAESKSAETSTSWNDVSSDGSEYSSSYEEKSTFSDGDY